jgi:hypothetical protein
MLALVQGLLYVAWMSAADAIGDGVSRKSVVGYAICGAALAALTGLIARREWRSVSRGHRRFTEAERRAIARAAATGTPPEDPALRRVALAMLHRQLAQNTRYRSVLIVMFVVVGSTCAIWAATDSLWYLVGVAVVVWVFVDLMREPGELRRHIASLQDEPV